MKKIIKTILVLLLVLLPVTFASAKTTTTAAPTTAPGKVTMYVFYGSTCPHCQELENYIKNTLKKNKELEGKFEVVYYEVWNDATNSGFLTTLGQKINYEIKGVPFFMIGEKYYSGYGEQMNSEIETRIKTEAENPGYVDVVAKTMQEAGVKLNTSDPESAISSPEDEKDESKTNDMIGYIILGVTVVVLILIIFTRRTDDFEEEVEEEKPEVKKAETKSKSTSTKTTTTKKKTTKKK